MPSSRRKPDAPEMLTVAAAGGARVQVRVVRSARRTKSIGVGWAGPGLVEARAPLNTPAREIERAVAGLLPRLEQARARRLPPSDEQLDRRAQQLNQRYFEGQLVWRSVRFVGNQRTRHGSCTPGEGAIRISGRLQSAPAWVLDYVLIHELAHLLEPNHSAAFWALVDRYPLAERARGFLLGMAHAGRLPHEEDDDANRT